MQTDPQSKYVARNSFSIAVDDVMECRGNLDTSLFMGSFNSPNTCPEIVPIAIRREYRVYTLFSCIYLWFYIAYGHGHGPWSWLAVMGPVKSRNVVLKKYKSGYTLV